MVLFPGAWPNSELGRNFPENCALFKAKGSGK
jgi:hypothetical protein